MCACCATESTELRRDSSGVELAGDGGRADAPSTTEVDAVRPSVSDARMTYVQYCACSEEHWEPDENLDVFRQLDFLLQRKLDLSQVLNSLWW